MSIVQEEGNKKTLNLCCGFIKNAIGKVSKNEEKAI